MIPPTPTPSEQIEPDPQANVQQAQAAADQAAQAAAQSAASEGSDAAETQDAAQQAAADAAREVAPQLTDDQVKRISDASGKAAAKETIAELRRLGALREENPQAEGAAQTQHAQSQTAVLASPQGPASPTAPPPPIQHPGDTEIQQEVPRKRTLAERFVGKK